VRISGQVDAEMRPNVRLNVISEGRLLGIRAPLLYRWARPKRSDAPMRFFLLGTWRYGQLRLGADGTPLTPASFDSFFDQQPSEWKIPAADVRRVREVVDQAIEHVVAKTQGPVRVQVGSDSFDIRVILNYTGNLPNLPDARPSVDLVEEQSFVSAA